MRVLRTLFFTAGILIGSVVPCFPENCKNPDAIGTSRTMTVNPVDFPLVGKLQYVETLRLRDREVVLTFDDGPVEDGTDTILDELAKSV